MTLYDDLNTVYTMLSNERNVLVTNISKSETYEDAGNNINALVELDTQINVILVEINKLTLEPEQLVSTSKVLNDPKKEKVTITHTVSEPLVAKKKVGRPSKK
jgi:hypothetical protein